tara:strand:- start:190 stop:885 length:696 start_codon:yes stop_codon:yes gene_type:complete
MPNTLKYRINSKKSLCKSKKEKKCKKIKGCKMARGPKKTFCRKIKNKKYGKTMKKRGGTSLGDVANIVSKTPLGKQAKERYNAKKQELLSTEIPIDENTLKVILNKLTKLDEKKIEAFIKDEELKKIFLSGKKEEALQTIINNPNVRELVIGKVKEEVNKNPQMKMLVMEVAKEMLMKGGEDFDRSRNSVDALKRVYSNKDHQDLKKIMMDPKESIESKRAAQQLLMEKYI